MMDYSSAWIMRLRRIGQRLRILRPLQRTYRALFRRDYEEAFDSALRAAIRPGDTVWDVGANVGHYAVQFAGLAGPAGRVVAFEPSPSSLPQLRAAVQGHATVTIREMALSNHSGEAQFYVSTQGASANEGLSAAGSDTGMVAHGIRVERGEDVARAFPPHVIKIDVEGFELEVIEGLGAALASPGLRTIAVEVHFQTLARRGRADAPARLARLLRDAGFALRWTDPSHLVASR